MGKSDHRPNALKPLSMPTTPSHSPTPSRKGSKTPSSSKLSSTKQSKYVSSRMEISAVTINMSGRSILGLTPKYKVDMVETFLQTLPDVIFLQDSIDEDDMQAVLKKVSNDGYKSYFQPAAVQNQNEKASNKSKTAPIDETKQGSITGIAWNKTKYLGTPLMIDDERIKGHSDFLLRHHVTIVKIDSAERHEAEDVHPSFVAVSWHGPDYEKPLRQRTQECDQLFDFITLLRKNNRNMPVVVGGDFNMDMKSYDMKKYPEFLLVPYRPVSGSLAKDLRNSFVFTFDCLQVTETAFKQHHPDIFAQPFITIKLRGRNTLRLWAVIRIQRAVRKMIAKIHAKRVGIKKLAESKKRWRKKIEGDDYVSSEEDEHVPEPITPTKNNLHLTNDQIRAQQAESARRAQEDYAYRRRKSFTLEGSRNIMDDFYNKPMEVPVSNYRRRHYDDLKSVQDRKKEDELHSDIMRSGI